MTTFALTKEQLLKDLYKAYYEARKHKRNKPYQKRFECRLEQNIASLCDDLWIRTYKPLPSQCFIITDPKKREVFAASFRDRIVHHLYFDYVHEMFERTFIQDSYSCIKNRGTHYGINRLEMHIRQESQNFSVPCYVLKLDIRGYFMHINRQKLLEIVFDTLDRMSNHHVSKNGRTKWCEIVDFNFVRYLTKELVLLNPVVGCKIVGDFSDWCDLPADKSLFKSPEGCGLPIGNLTSQLFSNVYMNVFDQYIKRELKCRHYGRYVDDSYIVSSDIDFLHSIIPKVRSFLELRLGLSIHDGKLIINDIMKGVTFLGAFLKPRRKYICNGSLRRMRIKINVLCKNRNPNYLMSSMNSYFGVLGHYKSIYIQKVLLSKMNNLFEFGKCIRTKKRYKYVLGVTSNQQI